MADRKLTVGMLKEIAPYFFLCGVVIVIWYLIPLFQEIYPFIQPAIIAVILFFSGLALRGGRKKASKVGNGGKPPTYSYLFWLIALCLRYFHGDPLLEFRDSPFSLGAGASSGIIHAFENMLKYILPLGLVVLSFSSLGLYGVDSKSSVLSRGSEWLLNSRLKIAVGLCLLVFYFIVFRPLFLLGFKYLPIIDWGIVAYTAWRLFTSARPSVTREDSDETFDAKTFYKKHEQKVEKTYDDDLTDLEEAQEIFVEEGRKEILTAELVETIKESEIRDKEIPSIIAPLVNHQDKPVPDFALDWTKERARRKNERKRESVVARVMNEIEERKGAHP